MLTPSLRKLKLKINSKREINFSGTLLFSDAIKIIISAAKIILLDNTTYYGKTKMMAIRVYYNYNILYTTNMGMYEF